MKKVIITALCAVSLLNLTGCDKSDTNSVQYVSDVRNLQWGMSADEVKLIETSDLSNMEFDGDQILLHYPDVDLYGYSTEMILCIEAGYGLNGVNYHIESNEFQSIYNNATLEYGAPNESEDNYAKWIVEEKNYIVYLFLWGDGYTQYSIFPIIDDTESSWNK